MAEESLKDELRAALSVPPGRQPRNLLSAPPVAQSEDAADEPKEPHGGETPGLLSRLLRRA